MLQRKPACRRGTTLEYRRRYRRRGKALQKRTEADSSNWLVDTITTVFVVILVVSVGLLK